MGCAMTFAWNDENIQRVVSLFRKDNKSIRNIAKEVGTTSGTISGKLARLNIRRSFSPGLLVGRNRQEAKRQRKQRPAVAPAPAAPKFSAETFELPAQRIDDVARKPFMSLEKGDCKWPIGDPRNRGEFGFCALPASPGRPYCDDHCRRAHTSRDELNDRNK